jgi:hypothetical protein
MYFAPKVFRPWSSLTFAARSLYLWSFYIFTIGIFLLFMPTLFLRLTGMTADPQLFWIRMVGVFLLSMAFMSHQAAVRNVREFFYWAVVGRFFGAAVFFVCAVIGLSGPMLFFFSLLDFAGGVWTYTGIKKDEAAAAGQTQSSVQPAL